MLIDEKELLSKKEVIEYLNDVITEINDYPEHLVGHTTYFQKTLKNLLIDFQEEIKMMVLPKVVGEGWFFWVEVKESGAQLILVYYGEPYEDDIYLDKDITTVIEQYVLLNRPCRLLTVEEYAKVYNASEVAVRQWIRRGKLRSAIKMGNEWRIPELNEAGGRGYSSALYEIAEDITDFEDDKYKIISSCEYVEIHQDENDKSKYILEFTKRKEPDESSSEDDTVIIEVDQKERERFEMLLMANPFIKYSDDVIISSS